MSLEIITTTKQLFRELPYYGVSDIATYHGQYNNTLPSNLPTKKYLD